MLEPAVVVLLNPHPLIAECAGFRQASPVGSGEFPGDGEWQGSRSAIDLPHLPEQRPHELGFVE